MNKNNIIKSNHLNKFPNLTHGFFTRNHNYDFPNQNNLDFSIKSNNNSQLIQSNYQIAAKTLNIKINQIIIPNQYHSNIPILIENQIQADQIQKINIKADSIVTSLPNLYISVLTADCVPILIYDHTKKYIAAIHAGWQGAFSGIIQNTIELNKIKKQKNVGYNFVATKSDIFKKKLNY